MPTNTNVFRGADATLILAASTATPAEAQEAQRIVDFHLLNPIGRASGVEVHVHNDLRPYYEIGSRQAVQLHHGNLHISGKLDRAYINGALLEALLGGAASVNRQSAPHPQPAFIMAFHLNDPAGSGLGSVVTLHGVKFDQWAFNLPEDDFVMEAATFKALYITVEDTVSED
ncbi:MAG: hypothetical protein OHK0046_42020 [Anaerolineae bacterium]